MKKVPSERESSFERLLRDTLRAGAPTVSDTSHVDGCLDAETLAAWAEQTLSSRERSAAEAHAADCARCQAMLAAMARTTPAAVEAPWWRVHMMAWMVPMSAAAAALILWIALPMMRGSYAPGESAGRVAQAQPASPVDATVVPEIERSAREQKSDASRDERGGTTAGARALRPREEFGRGDTKDRKLTNSALAKNEALSVRPDGNVASETRAKALSDTARMSEPTAPAARTGAPGAAAASSAGTAAPPPQPSAVSSAAAATSPAAVAAPVPAAPQPPASIQERAAIESAREAAQVQQRAADRILARQALTAPRSAIVSPNPQSQWRIVPGGTIQRSTDGGATWQTQQTGVTTTFTAGASPSTLVCWIVGPRGAVQLSINGIAWKSVPLPEAIDLVSISATDEKKAVVTAVDGRSFVTVDGGATWQRR